MCHKLLRNNNDPLFVERSLGVGFQLGGRRVCAVASTVEGFGAEGFGICFYRVARLRGQPSRSDPTCAPLQFAS